MKKMALSALIVSVVALGMVGLASAQTQSPPVPNSPSSGGMRGRGFGMLGRSGSPMIGSSLTGSYGPLHAYMITALAEAFGLTPQELQARHDAGDTLWDIAQESGLTAEEFSARMLQARSEAINQAAADGVITQTQADWMLQRMQQRNPYGFGPESGQCGGFGGRGQGWRWNTTPAP